MGRAKPVAGYYPGREEGVNGRARRTPGGAYEAKEQLASGYATVACLEGFLRTGRPVASRNRWVSGFAISRAINTPRGTRVESLRHEVLPESVSREVRDPDVEHQGHLLPQ